MFDPSRHSLQPHIAHIDKMKKQAEPAKDQKRFQRVFLTFTLFILFYVFKICNSNNLECIFDFTNPYNSLIQKLERNKMVNMRTGRQCVRGQQHLAITNVLPDADTQGCDAPCSYRCAIRCTHSIQPHNTVTNATICRSFRGDALHPQTTPTAANTKTQTTPKSAVRITASKSQ